VSGLSYAPAGVDPIVAATSNRQHQGADGAVSLFREDVR